MERAVGDRLAGESAKGAGRRTAFDRENHGMTEERHRSGNDSSFFGQIALKYGFVTEAQVRDCLRLQAELAGRGERKRLGRIMVDRGFLTGEDVWNIFQIQSCEQGLQDLGGFRVGERIGRGGTGVVYRARQVVMDREVALKILLPPLSRRKDFVDRFLREARAAARLNHPHVVTAIDAGEAYGLYYFAMEYVGGGSLRELLEREGALGEERSVRIAMDIAKALDHAHRHGMVHRDVKPGNILLTPEGTAKLCDLGLAKGGTPGGGDPRMGTPAYVSPEQARGSDEVDIRSDIYSLGATFFHMLTGRCMFRGEAKEVVLRQVREKPPSPREIDPGLSPGCAAVFERMTAKDPADRYSSPEELLADLRRHRESLGKDLLGFEDLPAAPGLAGDPPPPRRSPRPIAPVRSRPGPPFRRAGRRGPGMGRRR